MDAQGSIDAAAERSALVRRADEVASEAHAGQTRVQLKLKGIRPS